MARVKPKKHIGLELPFSYSGISREVYPQMDDIKEKKDIFQNDSIPKVILAMAIPTIISQMITVLYNYADTIFIGQLNDPLQSAAIALALPLTFLITAIANCWGIGGGSMISRSLGKGDLNGAKYAAVFSFYGALILTILCSVAVFGTGDAFDSICESRVNKKR